MNTNSINQEILLMTTSTFSQKQWCKKNAENNDLPPYEQLEEACWNGLLDEFLPAVQKPASGKKLFIWQIQHCESFLEIEMCDSLPLIAEHTFSINPYMFFDTLTIS